METLYNEIEKHVHPTLFSHDRAMRAYREFIKRIPRKILDMPLDVSRSHKQGIVKGEKVYKFGYVLERELVFIEYFEDRNQGQPTISLYADRKAEKMSFYGRKAEKNFSMDFSVINGMVECKSKFE